MTRRSDRCCKHKPVSPKDEPATWAENTRSLCTPGKKNIAAFHICGCWQHGPSSLLPRWGSGPQLSDHLGIRRSLLRASVRWHHTVWINEMGHGEEEKKKKRGASSNIKPGITDEPETSSCFISSRAAIASILSGSLGVRERCPYAPLTHTAAYFSNFFFSRKDKSRLHALVIWCQDTTCFTMPAGHTKTLWPAVERVVQKKKTEHE